MASSQQLGKDRRLTVDIVSSISRGRTTVELHPNELSQTTTVPPFKDAQDYLKDRSVVCTIKGAKDLLTHQETIGFLAVLANHFLQRRWVTKPLTKKKGGNVADAPPPPPESNSGESKVAIDDETSVSFAVILTDLVNSLAQTPNDPFPAISMTSPTETNKNIQALLSTSSPLPLYISVNLPSLVSSALSVARSQSLLSINLVGASLSLEWMEGTTEDMWDSFDEQNFEGRRPHRGMIEAGNKLRSLVIGSKYFGHPAASATESTSTAPLDYCQKALNACRSIPTVFGPSDQALRNACASLSTELNVLGVGDTNSTEGTGGIQVGIAVLSAVSAVSALDEAARSRLNIDASPPVGADGISTCDENSKLSTIFRETVMGWQTTVLSEIEKGFSFAKKVEDEARKAGENAKSDQKGKNASNMKKQEDNFEGKSEAEIEKIMKKRREKEAKAAAKAAKKGGKKGKCIGEGNTKLVQAMSKLGGVPNPENIFSVSIEFEQHIEKLMRGGVKRKPKVAKGTRDYLPEQMAVRDEAFQIIRRVFKRHGAVEIDTPVFELKETLMGKYGEDSKLIYELADQGGESLALRYDLTVPFARFVALNGVGSIKRFHIGKVYRRDQPQLSKGRYREFYQCDFDICGDYGKMVSDSEVVSVVTEILSDLEIGDFELKLNHRRLLDAIMEISGVEADKFRPICSAIDKLDKEEWSTVKVEMIDKGVSADVAERIWGFVQHSGSPWELFNQLTESNAFGDNVSANAAMEELKTLFTYLEALDKLKYVKFDLSLARGLDYYTGLIYEAVCIEEGCQVGSIGGGGRYDYLVNMFSNSDKPTPCVGVSVGIERVFTLMEAKLRKQKGSLKRPPVNVLVASVGKNMMSHRMEVTNLLWKENISAEYTQREGNVLKREIASALDRDIPFMVIVGEEELKTGEVIIKDLVNREEVKVLKKDVAKVLLKEFDIVMVGCEFAREVERKKTREL